jgi:hypothetical protein
MLDLTRVGVIAEIARDVERALRGLRPLEVEYRHPDTSMFTTVERTGVRPAAASGPTRGGTFSYAPAATRGLVVYLMGTKIAEDLAHRTHLELAAQSLDQIEPRAYELDVIAFVVRALPEGLAALFTVADDATLTSEEVEALFHQWL